ncbi:EpsG family protein [Paenibacillus sp. B2(2019)]|uniref:EpsG family protein n=1 Tax=Paenibacillus sp. B2(2019) TaxID=2607754 RepID=UPI0011F31212|nr:EpsG family protein [Paenibacillus sp. B2(2019)]KAA1185334.1 EpsG family protein [Paenibacillus sp. B2(2019)]
MSIYFMNLAFVIILGLLFYMTGSNRVKERIFVIIAFTSIFFVSGFRNINVGTDTKQYQQIFSTVANIDITNLFKVYRSEHGYLLLNKILSRFTVDPQAITILTSAIIIYAFAVFVYYNSDNVYISTFLFLTTFYFCISLNASRQFISVALLCNSFYFFKKGKIKSFLAIILLSSMFHLSSILFILILPLKLIKPKPKNFIYITIISFSLCFLLMFSNNIILNLLSHYDVYQGTQFFAGKAVRGTYIIWISQLCLAIISIYFLAREKKLLEIIDRNELFYLSIFMVFSVVIGLIGTKIFIFSRMAYYFGVFMIIFIPKILIKLKGIGGVLYLPMFFLLTLYYYYMLNSGSEGVVPYSFFWQFSTFK